MGYSGAANSTAKAQPMVQSIDVPGPDEQDPGRDHKIVPPDMSDSSMEAICNHMQQHVGPTETVLHEIVSDRVHIDVHVVLPNEKSEDIILFTTGMSDLPMAAPEGAEEFRFAELVMALPAGWPIQKASFEDEANYWPVRWLKILARMPHLQKTWLSYGHTVPTDDPPKPFAPKTEMCCMLLMPPYCLPSEASELVVRDDKVIHFWMPVPIHADEMQFKLDYGAGALEDKFEDGDMQIALNPGRKSVLKKKKRFWFF